VPQLPSEPSLEHLRGQAKRLLRAVRAGDPAADIVPGHHPRPPAPEEFRLADAQLVVARAYGFPSWPRIVAHLEVIARYTRVPHRRPVDDGSLADRFLTLACLTYGADDPSRPARARELLTAHPELPHTSLAVAAAVGDPEAARPRLADARRPGGPHDWEPLLYLAYSRASGDGALAVARMLLDAGADPNAGYLWEGLPSPFTALTGALGGGEGDQPAHRDALALARLLLEAGADANDAQAIYNRSWTPGDEWLELLFAHGLGRGSGGVWHRRLAPAHPSPAELVQDLLLWSTLYGMTDRVRLVLRHDVDVDAHGTRHPIMRGHTALVQAVLDGSAEIAAALRAAGAREPELDAAGRLQAALMAADRATAERLRGAPVRPDLVARAAELGRSDAVRALVAFGLDVNHRGRATALHEAALRGDQKLVDLLLELGADRTITDLDYHATPAGWAEHGGHPALAAHLKRDSPL